MFIKLKTLVKGVVPYHITKIDPDQIQIANFIAIFQKLGGDLRSPSAFLVGSVKLSRTEQGSFTQT